MAEMQAFINKILAGAVWPFVGFVFALAIAIFLYGLMEFALGADNEEKRSKGKQHIVWGIIGLFIMFSVWGIISIIMNFVGGF